jgi:hypothetical protein
MVVMMRKILSLSLTLALVAGCSTVRVTKNPGKRDTGIRYYRPKPYLLVTPADPTGRLVNLKLEYLPDFNEEYSAHLRGRKTSLALEEGWNLVGVNGGKAEAKEKPPVQVPVGPDPAKMPNMVVAASNVPIGYYESVYDMAGPSKQLKGWRYIGFNVLGGAHPTGPAHRDLDENGNQVAPGCEDPLFGLVFFNGAMTFRRIEEIAGNQLCPMYVNPVPPPQPVITPSGEQPRLEPVTPAPGPVVSPVPNTPQAIPSTPAPNLPQASPNAAWRTNVDSQIAKVKASNPRPTTDAAKVNGIQQVKKDAAKPKANVPISSPPSLVPARVY